MRQTKQRRKYTEEENQFFLSCIEKLFPEKNCFQWKEISQLFNEKFPQIQPPPTVRSLKFHYYQSLDPSINREKISIEEHQIIINYAAQEGKKWRNISQILNRNENQIKNEFYRKILPGMMSSSTSNLVQQTKEFENVLDLYYPSYQNEDF
jgi:hypothetical protein